MELCLSRKSLLQKACSNSCVSRSTNWQPLKGSFLKTPCDVRDSNAVSGRGFQFSEESGLFEKQAWPAWLLNRSK